MRITRLAIVTLSLVAVVFAQPAVAEQERADLSRLVVIGDSLSAGYQNGSLLDRQQTNGYASLVARQAGVGLPLPLIAAPGIPNVLTIVDPGPPPLIAPAPGASAGRIDPLTQVMNLAVPGHGVGDALGLRPTCTFAPDPATILTDLVLGLPGCLGSVAMSQVEWAEALAPSAILVWIGNMDALRAAIVADPIALTPTAAFQADYAELLGRLAATGASLVVANVPDVTVIPFLTSAEQVAETSGLPLAVVGPVLGLAEGDFVTPDAFPLIAPILGNPALGPLPGGVVLTASEIGLIRESIAQFNAIIEREARRQGAALVDVNRLLDRLQDHGLRVRGQRLTTGFLGGLFSLDGVHPTNTGYAVLANEFIDALRDRFQALVPRVDVEEVAAEDELVPPPPAHHGGVQHVKAERAAAIRRALRAY